MLHVLSKFRYTPVLVQQYFNTSPGSTTSHDDQLQTRVSKNKEGNKGKKTVRYLKKAVGNHRVHGRADKLYIKHVMMAYIGAWGRLPV